MKNYIIILVLTLSSCGHDLNTPAIGTPQVQLIPGPTGSPGPSGLPGTNGTVITPIQFCPNFPPSSFPEFGLCLDNNLYAVYWDGTNTWLTEIPPGTYNSTATNAACSFQVLENCQIQNFMEQL